MIVCMKVVVEEDMVDEESGVIVDIFCKCVLIDGEFVVFMYKEFEFL